MKRGYTVHLNTNPSSASCVRCVPTSALSDLGFYRGLSLVRPTQDFEATIKLIEDVGFDA